MYSRIKLEEALGLMGGFLEQSGYPASLVVCGGAALSIQGVVARTTKDASSLPEEITRAAESVASTLALPRTWLNNGPALQFKFGFPQGFEKRLEARKFGGQLTIYFIGRLDQIHLKLFAAADQGPGKHVEDLITLDPTEEEMRMAAAWVRTQDASESFPAILRDLIHHLGFRNVAEGL